MGGGSSSSEQKKRPAARGLAGGVVDTGGALWGRRSLGEKGSSAQSAAHAAADCSHSGRASGLGSRTRHAQRRRASSPATSTASLPTHHLELVEGGGNRGRP